MVSLQRINVRLYSYNSSVLDKGVRAFIEMVRNVGGKVSGPIPLPKKIEEFVVTRSPHVDKKSMEHFTKTTYKRLVSISGITSNLLEELSKIEIQSGIGVEISITNS